MGSARFGTKLCHISKTGLLLGHVLCRRLVLVRYTVWNLGQITEPRGMLQVSLVTGWFWGGKALGIGEKLSLIVLLQVIRIIQVMCD